MLQYKTRGMSTPQGKPRVYICCHPADFDRHAEALSDEILNSQNCAVWVDTAPGEARDEEAFALDLRQMHLFVLPVTTRFLVEPNRARDVEFREATAHHIPVLPILMEPGLEALFNQTCGDLHLISRVGWDGVVPDYGEKLARVLHSVLVSDELAAKVRAAFDAYIFLSYRKKDKKYAQELMRLIHQNEFCRDIAIWYDEFLTPGENFNDAIRAALNKSALFALVVTPNLVNEPNYVMTTEYPAAQAASKAILPVEAVPTDATALSDKYRGLPTCVPANDPAVLSAALLEQVRAMAIEENDASPEHNFFIGLAYLGGIDVEIDHDRAVGLITAAAEAGLPEAMEKLVVMTRSGAGVARDYAAAVEWQTRLVAAHKEIYQAVGDESTGLALLSALGYLGDCVFWLGDIQRAEQLYAEMSREAQTLYQRTHSLRAADCLLDSHRNLGDMALEQGHAEDAEAHYRRGLELSKILAEETNTVLAWEALAHNYNRIGRTQVAMGYPYAAREYYEKDLEIVEAIALQLGTAEARRALAVSYNHLGDLESELLRPSVAKGYYLQGLALAEDLVPEEDTPYARRDLSISYDNLGDVERALGNPDAARTYYLQSLAITEVLAAETETIQARRDLSITCTRLGETEQDLGRPDAALTYFLKDLAIAESLAEAVGTPETRRDLSVSYENLGNFEQNQGHLRTARDYFLKSLELSEACAAEADTIEARRDLWVGYNQLGEIEGELGRPDAARAYFLKDLAIASAIVEETGTLVALQDLSSTYEMLGDLERAQGNATAAKEYYLKSLDIQRVLAFELAPDGAADDNFAPELDTVAEQNKFAVLCLALAGLEKNKEQARQHLGDALSMWASLSAQHPEKSQFARRRDDAVELMIALETSEE